MKKISEKQEKKNAQTAYKRWRHNLVRAQKRKQSRVQRLIFERTGGEYIPIKYNLDAPSQFNLVNENFDDIIKFLQTLRKQSLVTRRQYSVNFKTIQEISPIAALILTAEIDRWRRIKRARLRPAELRKWNPIVRRLLNEMGFFEVLEIENPCLPEDKIADKEVEFIKFISDNRSDGSYAKKLRQSLESVAGTINTRTFMYTGLTEAMNVDFLAAFAASRASSNETCGYVPRAKTFSLPKTRYLTRQ